MNRSVFALCFLAGAMSIAYAQSHQPYAGLQERTIRALSEEQIADLRAGRGMGLALAAELNGYPGPVHVLELADELGLTDAQRTGTEHLFEAMKTEAMPLGERLISQEAELDTLFRTRTAMPASIVSVTRAIGATQAELRATHLKYHLSTVEVLTAEQVRRYEELRGYTDRADGEGRGHGGHEPPPPSPN